MTDKKDSRRKLLKSIAAGSSAVVMGKSLPESWSKPVINSIVLPAHAELTDGSGSSGGDATTTPAPQNYFGLSLVLDHLSSLDKTENTDIFAGVVNALIPKAHASITDDIDMSVVVSGSSATVRFTNGRRNQMFNVVAPINGDASGTPTYEGSGCEPSKGPKSVQLIAYTPGDKNVQVRVNGGDSKSWEVIVPEATIETMSVACDSDLRLKTNVEALPVSREGYNLYKFQYIDDKNENNYVGVMAQDVISRNPEAVVQNESGFYSVRYGLLGLKMVTFDEWESEGPDSVELRH